MNIDYVLIPDGAEWQRPVRDPDVSYSPVVCCARVVTGPWGDVTEEFAITPERCVNFFRLQQKVFAGLEGGYTPEPPPPQPPEDWEGWVMVTPLPQVKLFSEPA
ncbi:MAG: hypothetical protein AB7G06_06105 [Bdellovibrionales bacterium]